MWNIFTSRSKAGTRLSSFVVTLIFAASIVATCCREAAAEPYTAIGKYEDTGAGDSAATALPISAYLQQRFHEAVFDAEIAEPSEISRTLTPLTDWNSALRSRDGALGREVLVVTWTSYTGYDAQVGTSITLSRDVWVTVVPDVQAFCRKQRLTRDLMTLRLEQLLGLPPGNGKTRFVEMWASTSDLFRPSPDPETTDREASIDFPQPLRAVSVTSDYALWFQSVLASSYGPNGYPWTRLGYTYDWKPGASEKGLSEFVVPAGSTVEISSVTLNADYYAGR